jgi:hypothetical protein
MTVVVFYAAEGARAKAFAREIEASKLSLARVCDVTSWDGKPIKGCDYVQVMPDVKDWQREKIEAVYGPLVPADGTPETPPVKTIVAEPLKADDKINDDTQLSLLDQAAEPSRPRSSLESQDEFLAKRARARQQKG